MIFAIFREARIAGNVDYLCSIEAQDADATEDYAKATFDLSDGERFLIKEEDDEHILQVMAQAKMRR